MIKRTFILEVPSWQALQKSRQLVFNRFGIHIYGVTSKASDTDFSYNLYTEQRINKALLSDVQSYVFGIVDTLRSF